MFVSSTNNKEDDVIPVDNSICYLNDDIIDIILRFIPHDISTYLKFGAVSKQFYALTKSEELWFNFLRNKYPFLPITDNYRFLCVELQKFLRGKKDKYQEARNSIKITLVVLGSTGVGKSSLTFRFIEDIMVENYDPTIVDCFQKQMTILQDKKIMTQVLDLSDYQCEHCRSEEKAYFRSLRTSSAFIAVCSLTDKESLEELNDYIDNICWQKDLDSGEIPIMMVASKKDLVNERIVTEDELKAFGEKYNIPYRETSALSGENVSDVFTTVAEMAYIQEAFNAIMRSTNEPPKKQKCIIN
ncbi:Ras-related protein Rap [Acrasis kona]|uniref:Ras-related protein Rap n=1 Tax=Acrasis kona TaxID=1008807 RepID=A0AAW2ZCX6_9EUKA